MIHQRLKCKRKAEFPININKSERKLNHNRKIKGVEQEKKGKEKKRQKRKFTSAHIGCLCNVKGGMHFPASNSTPINPGKEKKKEKKIVMFNPHK